MATPGWYPDPAGRAGAFRYWDGQAWGSELSDHPYAAPPGAAPAPTGGFQSSEVDLRQQAHLYQGLPVAEPEPGPAPLWPVVLLTAVATLVVGVVTFFVVGALL